MKILQRYILMPFALLYGLVLMTRMFLYKTGLFHSFQPPIPTIVVGNLSMGGTGKTPHVEWLIRALQYQYKIAVLSRGYGRSTRGFMEVQLHSSADEVGDEPKQIKQKFPDVTFAVCEKRKDGIQELLKLYPDLQLIILDDAMQHLAVSGGFTLMLSEFHKPFFKDLCVPAGRLREFAFLGKKRADVCVFTKCPPQISEATKKQYISAFSDTKPVYFSSFDYGAWQSMSQREVPSQIKHMVLVTGIANPLPFVERFNKEFVVELVRFADHHNYTEKDIAAIHRIFANFDASTTMVLTTEKDAVKLSEMTLITENLDVPWAFVPIEVAMENEEELIKSIEKYVESYQRGG